MSRLPSILVQTGVMVVVAASSSLLTIAADRVVVIPLGNSDLRARVAALEAVLAGVSRDGNDITFSGVNVHIVDGSGDTSGPVNGLGNLIVGYNELRNIGGMINDRSGSHNLVVGSTHNFSSYGGLLAGHFNNSTAPFASVTGGYGNTASGSYASVSGGQSNEAKALYASVSGGANNDATGSSASICGGLWNTASGNYASVSGGEYNTASGLAASVSGGLDRTAGGTNDWRAGTLFQDL